MEITQYDIFWVDLDPTKGSEIKKIRPCLIISPNEMNKYLNTVIIAPMTSTFKAYPTRIEVKFQNKIGSIILDQIRCIDKNRLKENMGKINKDQIQKLKNIIKEMLID